MFTILKHFICRFLASILFLNSGPLAIASEIVVDSSATSANQAIIDQANNGAAIVNISGNLSANGLSHNKFSKFDVDEKGVVINNSTEFGVSHLTGSTLYNNPLLQSGAASVILNEVTGGNVSELYGYTEIFGQKADYIFANPQGIVCDGCGFINTDRLTMVTGSAEKSNGELSHFNIGAGAINIGESGLDASMVSAAELVSQFAYINGAIFAKDELSIKTGDKQYDYTTGNISSNDTVASDSDITYAVDASNFGAMYAGKIDIIASKDGFGVKSESDLHSSVAGLTITANGDIELKNASAATDITLSSTNNIETNGTIYSVGNTTLNAGASIDLSAGSLVANNINAVAATDLDINGTIYSYGDLSLDGQNISILASGIIAQDTTSLADLFLTASNDFTNEGNIYGNNNIDLIAANQISNSGSIEANQALD
ncbi:filamentous hemagglutinin N-terminal domain-containing protein, partial [Rickettsiales bacterium]|nr:filamentous hemagglutinin N-terminal domain-containing protein [Rickettsiales bacterium]